MSSEEDKKTAIVAGEDSESESESEQSDVEEQEQAQAAGTSSTVVGGEDSESDDESDDDDDKDDDGGKHDHGGKHENGRGNKSNGEKSSSDSTAHEQQGESEANKAKPEASTDDRFAAALIFIHVPCRGGGGLHACSLCFFSSQQTSNALQLNPPFALFH